MAVGADASPGDASGSAPPLVRLCAYRPLFQLITSGSKWIRSFPQESPPFWLLGNRDWVLAADQRDVDEILGEGPHLVVSGADHLGDDQVSCAIVAVFGHSCSCVVSVDQDQLVR